MSSALEVAALVGHLPTVEPGYWITADGGYVESYGGVPPDDATVVGYDEWRARLAADQVDADRG